MACEPRQLYTFIQGSDITGESAFDVWKRVHGSDSEEEFLAFLQSGPQGDVGERGERGPSGYDEWVALPQNIGKSKLEYFESLRGPAGQSTYDIWKAVGNTGTAQDFLNDLKGKDGDNGKSSYDVWKDAGNEGTEQDFIDDLKMVGEPVPYVVLNDASTPNKYFLRMNKGHLESVLKYRDISIGTMPNKTNYVAGEEFDPEGLVVLATSYDGATRTITDFKFDAMVVEGKSSHTIYIEAGIQSIEVPITIA